MPTVSSSVRMELQMTELLTREQVAARLKVSPSTLDRMRKADPFFPAPVRLPGGRTLRWRDDALDSWLDSLGGQ